MSRKIVYPYKMGSESAKKLANALVAIRVFPDRKYRPKTDDLIINWGSSVVPNWANDDVRILNKPQNVAIAVNKLHCFQKLQEEGIMIPDFTTDIEEALGWAGVIYARTKLTGHSGEGIIVVKEDEEDFPVAPLYTRQIINTGEYRVHVFNGQVIDYRKKSRRSEETEITEEQSLIRNISTGWVFRRSNLKRLERIEVIALRAVQALGLDFGAVDIIKDEDGMVYVLEVNTACAMEDQTLEVYLEAINSI